MPCYLYMLDVIHLDTLDDPVLQQAILHNRSPLRTSSQNRVLQKNNTVPWKSGKLPVKLAGRKNPWA